MHLNPSQKRLLEEIRTLGSVEVSGWKKRTVESLVAKGLVKANYETYQHRINGRQQLKITVELAQM